MALSILCIAGPTASGKSARAVEEALARNGEIISVDSRQVYRGLDIGTEKITKEEMRGVPHHLIDIREVNEIYSAGDFVADATRLIEEISGRGKLPILVGGTHFYFDALLKGLPAGAAINPEFRTELEKLSTEELYARIFSEDARRASEIDPQNRRRLIRALEIISSLGSVPPRGSTTPPFGTRLNLVPEWIVINPPREELRARIDARLKQALGRGLIDEVRHVREKFGLPGQGDERLNELGLEYKIVGEFLNLEVELPSGSSTSKLFSALSAKLWQYARHQKSWLKKLSREII
ncbi:MAG: tRNA (adenosine(37)-N6)-dimethylallyltransferase MiaA [Candidatus Paceibacterota bacterium]|jgi:tRNA dimethylallyltransferase